MVDRGLVFNIFDPVMCVDIVLYLQSLNDGGKR
jgi:hypothetical protein